MRPHRGGSASAARKTFAMTATRDYGVPVRVVAEYLGVSAAAVSAMSHAACGWEVPPPLRYYLASVPRLGAIP
jgi:hypothetical protein